MFDKSIPLVSVVMAVFNAEDYLEEAIKSILNQTFTDFEFIIINDASTDHSLEIINSFHDRRISVLSNESNQGLANSLNRGFDAAKGEFIARMDADDISRPYRLTKQVEFMRSHPDVDICGSWAKTFGFSEMLLRCPTGHEEIRCTMLFSNPMAHPTVIIRNKRPNADGIRYEKDRRRVEDYELWSRLSKSHKFENISEVLLDYRVYDTTNLKKMEAVLNEASKITFGLLSDLGIDLSNEEKLTHRNVESYNYDISKEFLLKVDKWFSKIIKANLLNGIYDHQTLSRLLAKRWWGICLQSTKLGFFTWSQFNNSQLADSIEASFEIKVKFFVKCMIRSAFVK